ncbi:hypothetical protein GEMRC1_009126 [Eukaryota sp. GEM-RC1]
MKKGFISSLQVATAPLSLQLLKSASDSDRHDETQEARVSDRNVALLNFTLGRKGIETNVPLLKALDGDHILSWIEDIAAYAITKEDTNNSLLRSYLYTNQLYAPLKFAKSKPLPEWKEQLEGAHSTLTAEVSAKGETTATLPSPFEDTLAPHDDFHVCISRDVMNSIQLISTHFSPTNILYKLPLRLNQGQNSRTP